ncbi:MAG: fused MFS/spermidine synthase [Solobacterium sp.]|nr:fused MFS/spermidine synthase [Solobacterium sp.]
MKLPAAIRTDSGICRIDWAAYQGRKVLVWSHNDTWHSAVYADERYRYEPVFVYEQKFDLAFRMNEGIRDILMIGAGMYTYPASVLHRFADTAVTAVEIDPSLRQLAEEYFFPDGIDRGQDLKSVTMDGRKYLEETDEKYDLIVFDAYDGILPYGRLITQEAAILYREHLHEKGILTMNFPGVRQLQSSDMLLDELKTLTSVFSCVRVVRAAAKEAGDLCNYVIFASMSGISAEGMLEYDLSSTVILKDRDAAHFHEFYQF